MYTLNGKQVYTLQEAFAYAMAIGQEFSRNGVVFDENCSIGIDMKGGCINHIWIHAVRECHDGADLFRLAIGPEKVETFVWWSNSKRGGWEHYEL